MQPTLAGLPPLLVMVGGGELLRDEQIYLAHKCARPEKYGPAWKSQSEAGRELINIYEPTRVQLQVWDNLCHVAPTLSFSGPAKHMYRSIAQFGSWALDQALFDPISMPISERGVPNPHGNKERSHTTNSMFGLIEGAGHPLPPFTDYMIRQRVSQSGVTSPLAPKSELPGCCMPPESIGQLNGKLIALWIAKNDEWKRLYANERAKARKKMVKDITAHLYNYDGDELPPPSALAGRLLR